MCQQFPIVKYLAERNKQDLQDVIARPDSLHIIASHDSEQEDVAKNLAELIIKAGCKLDYQDEKVFFYDSMSSIYLIKNSCYNFAGQHSFTFSFHEV